MTLHGVMELVMLTASVNVHVRMVATGLSAWIDRCNVQRRFPALNLLSIHATLPGFLLLTYYQPGACPCTGGHLEGGTRRVALRRNVSRQAFLVQSQELITLDNSNDFFVQVLFAP